MGYHALAQGRKGLLRLGEAKGAQGRTAALPRQTEMEEAWERAAPYWNGVLPRRRAEEGVPDCSTTSARSSRSCQACTATAFRPLGAPSGPPAGSAAAASGRVGRQAWQQ